MLINFFTSNPAVELLLRAMQLAFEDLGEERRRVFLVVHGDLRSEHFSVRQDFSIEVMIGLLVKLPSLVVAKAFVVSWIRHGSGLQLFPGRSAWRSSARRENACADLGHKNRDESCRSGILRRILSDSLPDR